MLAGGRQLLLDLLFQELLLLAEHLLRVAEPLDRLLRGRAFPAALPAGAHPEQLPQDPRHGCAGPGRGRAAAVPAPLAPLPAHTDPRPEAAAAARLRPPASPRRPRTTYNSRRALRRSAARAGGLCARGLLGDGGAAAGTRGARRKGGVSERNPAVAAERAGVTGLC